MYVFETIMGVTTKENRLPKRGVTNNVIWIFQSDIYDMVFLGKSKTLFNR